MVGNTVKTKMA